MWKCERNANLTMPAFYEWGKMKEIDRASLLIPRSEGSEWWAVATKRNTANRILIRIYQNRHRCIFTFFLFVVLYKTILCVCVLFLFLCLIHVLTQHRLYSITTIAVFQLRCIVYKQISKLWFNHSVCSNIWPLPFPSCPCGNRRCLWTSSLHCCQTVKPCAKVSNQLCMYQNVHECT